MAEHQDSDLLGDSGKVDATPLGEEMMLFIRHVIGILCTPTMILVTTCVYDCKHFSCVCLYTCLYDQ